MKAAIRSLIDDKTLRHIIPSERIILDELYRYAYSTDASCYRLMPEAIISIDSEEEMKILLEVAGKYQVPLTFRAAGTSLSGQAVTDSVLVTLTDRWRNHSLTEDHSEIRVQPGLIGAEVNRLLAPHGLKIGPDPASINTCKIGGIAANNASGMCCGTAQNTYHTLKSIRLILADGTLLDTGDCQSKAAFRKSHASLLNQISALAAQTQANESLAETIRHKFRLKNTTGYALNALVDYSDPIDILAHLMIGSEGTLGFIAGISYQTIPDYPNKASVLVAFETIESCCQAVAALKETPVDAVEIMDRHSLQSIEDQAGVPEWIKSLPEQAAALLIDARGESAEQLTEHTNTIEACLKNFAVVESTGFSRDPAVIANLWNIRKGMFPAVGAVRTAGTTVIIEDVAFPMEHLAEGVLGLQKLFIEHNYPEAIIFGHALAGNVHFVFTQAFQNQDDVAQYDGFMKAVVDLVVGFNGSLKAEHGTGRNMSPFVEVEWGHDGYALMKSIKQLLDPNNLLNPGVIINDDNEAHIKHLKAMPVTDSLVDPCIECGFCEPVCPSKGLTLTPRQRIATYRWMQTLEGKQLEDISKAFEYAGIDTCAATGLCANRCPVDINTGELIKSLRHDNNQSKHKIAEFAAKHYGNLIASSRLGLKTANGVKKVIGNGGLKAMTYLPNKLSGGSVPQWHPTMPNGASAAKPVKSRNNGGQKVVYWPACASQTFASGERSLHQIVTDLLEQAGFDIIIPSGKGHLCCGQPFASKGFNDVADEKQAEVEEELWRLSEQGQWPVFTDTSTCSYRMKSPVKHHALNILDSVEFIQQHLLDKLSVTPLDTTIAVHPTCSTQHMKLDSTLIELTKKLCKDVKVPEQVTCCGFAGDKGFTQPELNANALATLKAATSGCSAGVSNNLTCEIGLQLHSGLNYQSIFYLLEQCVDKKEVQDQQQSNA